MHHAERSTPKGRLPQIAKFLHRRRWLLLLLAVPYLLFPSSITSPILLIVPGLCITAWLAGDDLFPPTPLNVTLLLLYLMVLVSTVVTFDMTVSLPKIAGMVLGMGIFYVFVSYGQRARGFGMCLVAFYTAGLGVALLGLLGTNWSIKYSFLEHFTHQFAPLITGLPGAESGISPNELAGALLWVIPPFVALSIIASVQQKNPLTASWRWLAPIGLLFAEVTLFVVVVFLISQSRSSYLALVISGIVSIPVLLPRRWQWLSVVGLCVFAILSWAIYAQYGVEQLLGEVVGNYSGPNLEQSLETLGGRTPIWTKAALGIQRFPLTGMGMNTFRYLVNTLDPLNPIYVGRDIAHAHNEFLQVALDLGIPGLIAFLVLYFKAFAMLREVWKRASEVPSEQITGLRGSVQLAPASTRLLVVGLGAGLFAHILYGLTDVVALGAKPGMLFWMILGIVVSLYQQKQVQAGSL